ncbi:MAG: YdcF family protein [Longicatena sp.]
MNWFIGIICFVIMANIYLWMMFPSHKKAKHVHYDACIILGSPASKDGTCSRMQKSRMDRAIELYKAKKVSTLIISGGCVCNAYSEAGVMKSYALSKGIDEANIILEEKARNTYENLLYSKEICEQYNLHTVIVVTSNFHVRRASFFVDNFFDDYIMAGTINHEKISHYFSEYFRMWNTLRIEYCRKCRKK